MKNKFLYIILFSFSFSQFELDPRMLGMSGAYTSVASGYQAIGVNPANLVSNQSLSLNLFSVNTFMVNDFLSVDLYNQLNGGDFNNTSSASYFSKNDILGQIKGSNIDIATGLVFPFPIFNFAYKNFGISALIKSYSKFHIPDTALDIMLNGNTKDQRFLLDLGGEAVSCIEIGLSYAQKFDYLGFPVYLGYTFKPILGLAFFKMRDIEQNGSYILTEQTSFHASGKYLVEQAIGGWGISSDLGLLLPEFYDGWNIGASLINLGGRVKFTSDNLTRKLLGDTINNTLDLRQNEYYYLDFRLDTTIMIEYDIESNNYEPAITDFSSKSIKVGIFSDIPLQEDYIQGDILYYTVDSNGDSLINVGESSIDIEDVIDLGNGSYLVPSSELAGSQLQSTTSKDVNLDYPSSLRLGISKNFDEFGILSIDMVTGFDNSFGNSNKFRLSIATEIDRISENFPIRIGASFGGRQPSSYSLGFGYKAGPLNFDFGRKYYSGIIFNRAKGAEFALNLSIDLTDIRNYSIKLGIPKINLPKLPKLPT